VVCPLCQVKLVASSEEECIAHMASCTGFQARHPANVDGTSQSLGQNAAGSSAGSGMAGGGGASATTHAGYYVPGEDVVVLQGLEARPELNGKLAVVLGWHMSRGRWGVEILPSGVEGGTDAGTDGAQMRIRPKNLRWAGRISAGLGSTVLVEEASVECTAFPPGFARRPLFGGQFGIQVPTSGWMDTHAVEKNGLSVDGNELFVSEKALLGPGFAIISIRQPTSRPARLSAAESLRAYVAHNEEGNRLEETAAPQRVLQSKRHVTYSMSFTTTSQQHQPAGDGSAAAAVGTVTSTSMAALFEVGSSHDVYIIMSNTATEDLDWLQLICSFADCRARSGSSGAGDGAGAGASAEAGPGAGAGASSIKGSRQYWANAVAAGAAANGGGGAGGHDGGSGRGAAGM